MLTNGGMFCNIILALSIPVSAIGKILAGTERKEATAGVDPGYKLDACRVGYLELPAILARC